MTKKCEGCGYTLQSNDHFALGYVPKTKEKNPKLCERCFKIIHYNDAKIVTLPTEEKNILEIVNKSKEHVLFLIDFLNINEDTISVYNKVKVNKTLIISKSDIIPFSINQNKIINWLNEYYKIEDNIIFISALKNKNVNLLLNYLSNAQIKKAYLLGFTNAGKSSLVNSIIKTYELTKKAITTSLVPNTTLDFMNVKINDKLTLIDSPGFTLKNDIVKIDDLKLIKKINPKKFLKPITYQLKPKTAIKLEEYFILENISDKKINLTYYISNSLQLTKIYDLEKYQTLKSQIYDLNGEKDIVIKGIGFVNVKQKGKINIFIDNPDVVEIRDSLF